MEEYTDGFGHKLKVHNRNEDCDKYNCCIHNPSDHVMHDFPTLWRIDRNIMERVCPHGVGHPDPDSISFISRVKGEKAAYYESIHGCEGCCQVKINNRI